MINMISAVSIVAMAIPVAAIILLLSIFNGLERMALENLKSVDSDLSITPREGTTFRVEELPSALLDDLADVEQYSFILEQSALAQIGDNRAVVQLRGVDEKYTSVVPVADNILVGEFKTLVEQDDYVVAAHGVMQDLSSLRSTAIGESMQLYAINRTRISTLLPVGGYTRRELPIAGIYSIDEDNRSLVITSLSAAQSLFNYADRASAVEIRLREGASPARLAEQLQAAVGEHFEVRTREERNSIYRLMALEKWGVFCIAVLVMIVASLSIVGTLVMVIIDKRDDVRTLRTMGARRDFVRDIFTAEGLLMALLSLVLGLVLGAGLALLQQHFGFVGIDAQTLQVNAYPVEVHLQDILLTVAAYAAVSYIVVKLTVRALMRDNI
ncbi:MAG: ABC transporter permease [Alistipes sp.]|nr:ABC transporter permease [Alistipes sp.]